MRACKMPTKTASKGAPERVGAWIYGLGGRRFLLTMGGAAVNTALFAFKILSENGYLITFGMTIGAYIGSNTLEGMKTFNNPKKTDR